MTHFPSSTFSKKGVRKRTPLGKNATHPPSPAPGAGVTSHFPRSTGEDGRGGPAYPALARGGPAETA